MEIKQRNDPRSWTTIPAISEKKPKNIQGLVLNLFSIKADVSDVSPSSFALCGGQFTLSTYLIILNYPEHFLMFLF